MNKDKKLDEILDNVVHKACCYAGKLMGEDVILSKIKQQIKALYEPKERILVPENIKLSEIGILFGDNQELSVDTHIYCKGYDVINKAPFPISYPYYLVPCERKDLVRGDIAFHTNIKGIDFDCLQFYCVILDNDRYVYIHKGSNITVSVLPFSFWFKAIRV